MKTHIDARDIGWRIGRFEISSEWIDGWAFWSELLTFFGCMVVVRAENDYASRMIRYTALSPLFEVVEQWSHPPEYDIQIEHSIDPETNKPFGIRFKVVKK